MELFMVFILVLIVVALWLFFWAIPVALWVSAVAACGSGVFRRP